MPIERQQGLLINRSAGLRFYKIRFYKIQHNSIQHNCVYVVVYVCRNAYVWVFYLVETNLVETKACQQVERVLRYTSRSDDPHTHYRKTEKNPVLHGDTSTLRTASSTQLTAQQYY